MLKHSKKTDDGAPARRDIGARIDAAPSRVGQGAGGCDAPEPLPDRATLAELAD